VSSCLRGEENVKKMGRRKAGIVAMFLLNTRAFDQRVLKSEWEDFINIEGLPT
jgi:hypothetical protein